MSFAFWFRDVKKENVRQIGNKATSLVELLNFGFPTPQGFIVTTEAFEFFLRRAEIKDRIGEILENTDINDLNDLAEKSREIRELILNNHVPAKVEEEIKEKYKLLGLREEIKGLDQAAREMLNAGREDVTVIIRSSIPTNSKLSFAGIHDSFPNVQGMLGVVEAVKNCWASLFTPRAIYYRKRNNMDEYSMAVVVQQMIDSDKSGTTFTANPVNNNKNELIVESSIGFGKTISEGIVTPDYYSIDKQTEEIINKSLGKKEWKYVKDPLRSGLNKEKISEEESEILNEQELKMISDISTKIESHFNSPQEIEWGIQRDKLFILQTRNIPATEYTDWNTEKEAILQGRGASNGTAKGNAKIIRDPSDGIEQGDVIVAHNANVRLLLLLNKASGIITNVGGISSSLSNICRESRIPLIISKDNATESITDNSVLEIDGTNGKIYEEKIAEDVIYEKPEIVGDSLTATKIKLNIENLDELENIQDKFDGVGIIKAEDLLEIDRHPNQFIRNGEDYVLAQQIEDKLKRIAEKFYPKPVWFRIIDSLEKFSYLEDGVAEKNPLLGARGVRMSDSSLLKIQLNAVKNIIEKGYNNIGIIIPFVHDPLEIIRFKDLSRELGLELSRIDFGIEIGIPSAAFLAEEFSNTGINFISINSEELTRFMLGVDKNNQQVQHIHNEMHASVLKIIKKATREYKKQKIKTSFYGDLSNPEMIEKLVEYGVDSISSNINNAELVRNVISRTERKLLLDLMRERDIR